MILMETDRSGFTDIISLIKYSTQTHNFFSFVKIRYGIVSDKGGPSRKDGSQPSRFSMRTICAMPNMEKKNYM